MVRLTDRPDMTLDVDRGRKTTIRQRQHRKSTVFLRLYDGDFSFQNNPKDLDPSSKTDLDLWDCLGRVKLVLLQNFIGLI